VVIRCTIGNGEFGDLERPPILVTPKYMPHLSAVTSDIGIIRTYHDQITRNGNRMAKEILAALSAATWQPDPRYPPPDCDQRRKPPLVGIATISASAAPTTIISPAIATDRQRVTGSTITSGQFSDQRLAAL
jgi:hypothetical protein